jgi:elongation factor G
MEAESSYSVDMAEWRGSPRLISMRIRAVSHGDDERLQTALAELAGGDSTVHVAVGANEGDHRLEGMRLAQLTVICDRLCEEYGIAIDANEPQVILVERIRGSVLAEGKYIRQTGGAGNYGHCKLRVESNKAGGAYEFQNTVSNSAVPDEFARAVDRGVQRAMREDRFPRRPLVDLKATLVDGSFHPTDSNPVAFEMAGAKALEEALKMASTVILEPMMTVEVIVSEDFVEAVAKDVIERRGRVTSTETVNGWSEMTAVLPLAEVLDSVAQGLAGYPMEFAGYEPVEDGDALDEGGASVSRNNPNRPRERRRAAMPPAYPEDA